MQNPERFSMLPITIEKFNADLETRRAKVVAISLTGADLWEGDQWHSTAYRNQQAEKEVAIRYLQMLTQKMESLETLPRPQQNDQVEVGHMVKVQLPDDQEIIEAGTEYTLVHVLTPDDYIYLGGEFDGIQEMVIPFTSPLALAIIGRRRGETAMYQSKKRVIILEPEDAIAVSSLF